MTLATAELPSKGHASAVANVGLKVVKDMKVRWNTTYLMLGRHYRMQDELMLANRETFAPAPKNTFAGRLILHRPVEFQLSQQLVSVLEPWALWTNVEQSDHPTASLVLPAARSLTMFHELTHIRLVKNIDATDEEERYDLADLAVADMLPAARALFEFLGSEINTYFSPEPKVRARVRGTAGRARARAREGAAKINKSYKK